MHCWVFAMSNGHAVYGVAIRTHSDDLNAPVFFPDVFPDPDYRNIFSAIISFAAFQQLIVIIGCTIISGLLNRP